MLIPALRIRILLLQLIQECRTSGLSDKEWCRQNNITMDNYYVLSGRHCVIFKREFLEYDKEDWLGFNSERDFFGCVPSKGVLSECPIMFPGTAYNLNFVMKREES